jgi:sphingomyelin phosphodiesterase 2
MYYLDRKAPNDLFWVKADTHQTCRMQAVSMRVLTFNVWGLPVACKDLPHRTAHISEYLESHGKQLDVVLLQEVWTKGVAKQFMSAATKAGLLYSLVFESNLLGAGLLVLSRYPIVDAAFHAYAVRGKPGALQGEAMAGKGIGYACLVLPCGRRAHLFNTHMHANWAHTSTTLDLGHDNNSTVRVPTDAHAPFRVAQVIEAVCFIQRTLHAVGAGVGEPVIAGGDWNAPVDSLEMALLASLLPGMSDCWQAAGHAALDPAGNTCGDPANIYTGSILGGYVPERIDLLWTNCRVVDCRRTLTRIPTATVANYSDHYGVHATLEGSPAGALPSKSGEHQANRDSSAIASKAGERQVLLKAARDILCTGLSRTHARMSRNLYNAALCILVTGAFAHMSVICLLARLLFLGGSLGMTILWAMDRAQAREFRRLLCTVDVWQQAAIQS